MTSKCNIDSRIADLQEAACSDEDDGRIEYIAKTGMRAEEPLLSEFLAAQGFVIKKEEVDQPSRFGDVQLHATPGYDWVRTPLHWYCPGPTAPFEDLRILWDDQRLDAIGAAASHPVVAGQPTAPPVPVTVDEGDGWQAVVSGERIVTNAITYRSTAERANEEILGPAPGWVVDYGIDLVEIDAEPAPLGKRCSRDFSRSESKHTASSTKIDDDET